jgi:hypothetical protein
MVMMVVVVVDKEVNHCDTAGVLCVGVGSACRLGSVQYNRQDLSGVV